MGLAAFAVSLPRASDFRKLSTRLAISPLRRGCFGFGCVVMFGFVISWGVGKNGANINYCLESQLALCPLAGVFLILFLQQWRRGDRSIVLLRPLLLAALVATAFDVGVQTLVDSNNAAGWSGAAREKRMKERAEQAELVKLIAGFPGPVVSENMTLLLRAGKYVPFEPAIVQGNAEAGIFDESILNRRIAARFFDAFVLYNGTGRLTPNMKNAIESNYHSASFPSSTYTVYIRN
jgi:hypothetical protein